MNSECGGSFIRTFSPIRQKFIKLYICVWDGRSIEIQRKPAACPLCKRPLDPIRDGKYKTF